MQDQEPEGYHYGVMRRAIALIDQSDRTLSLDELAEGLSMSPAHFQRVFSRWVGVSPKRYQQYLALDHARSLLARRQTMLETAIDLGLSGTGRLHDLFVTWEAMTPGEYAARGRGLIISYGHFPSPFGEVLAMATARGISGLAFTEEIGAQAALADMTARWPAADFRHDPAAVAPMLGAATSGRPARLHILGAPFQIKVWEALLAIPSGEVASYGDIARTIGNPRAVRAVGTAVGRNPVAWLIPCHRALRASGGLDGYHWGQPIKRALLAWEGARRDNSA